MDEQEDTDYSQLAGDAPGPFTEPKDDTRSTVCSCLAPQGRKQLGVLSNLTVLCALLGTIVAIIIGSAEKSYELIFGGFTGWFLENFAGPGSSSVSQAYSLLSTYEGIPDSNAEPNDFGVRFIQFAFVGYAFLLPVLHVLCLLVLWLFPLSLRVQRNFFVFTETTSAWSAQDVFIFSIVVALTEIHTFASFLVEEPCGSSEAFLGGKSVNDVITEFFKSHDIDEAHTCMDVTAKLYHGCWALFIGGVIFLVVGQTIMKFARAAIHDRISAQYVRESISAISKLETSDALDLDRKLDSTAPEDAQPHSNQLLTVPERSSSNNDRQFSLLGGWTFRATAPGLV